MRSGGAASLRYSMIVSPTGGVPWVWKLSMVFRPQAWPLRRSASVQVTVCQSGARASFHHDTFPVAQRSQVLRAADLPLDYGSCYATVPHSHPIPGTLLLSFYHPTSVRW